MSERPKTVPRAARIRGVTLIELMVGLTLGMLISVAALKLFGDATTSGKNIQRASIQIENGRYAGELLREDLQLAGFFGEISTSGAAYTAGNPCETAPTGFVADPLGLPAPIRGLRAAEIVPCLANRRDGTDAIVARRLEVDWVNPASLTGANNSFHVQYSFCDADPANAPLIVGRSAATFALRDRACAAANGVRAYVSRIYFVANCSRCGSDSIPTLKRLDLVGTNHVETALVEGIETMRIEYGFDTDGNGSADVYRTSLAAAGAESRWENVVTLKLHFIVRSPEIVLGAKLASAQAFRLGGTELIETPNDGYARRAYSTTIHLVNPSAAREVQ
jgi:type IV pilus assembly protein PilW